MPSFVSFVIELAVVAFVFPSYCLFNQNIPLVTMFVQKADRKTWKSRLIYAYLEFGHRFEASRDWLGNWKRLSKIFFPYIW